MKKLIFLTITMCCIGALNARTYYFSALSGDDSHTESQAQDPATPWQSLGRLNAFFSNLDPGDSVLLKRGEVFSGNIAVTRSGTTGNPVVFSAYGSGSKPVINGLATLSGWVSLGGGVWEAPISPQGINVNMLVLNGTVHPMGRYPNSNEPNKGYLAIQSHSGATQITSGQLSSTPDWAGGEVVIRKARWILERNKITQHSGNTITFQPGPSGNPINNYGFFIQNHPKTLDRTGEWYYDNGQKKMQVFFGTANPNSFDVQASVTDNLVFIQNQNNIVFDNLSFKGADKAAFIIRQSNHIQVSNCDVLFSGTDGLVAAGSNGLVLENSSLVYTNNNAFTADNCTNASVRNNRIVNTGVFAGMGKNEGSYEAMLITFGTGNLVEFNVIDSTGYTPITFGGDAITIKNNYINYFCFTKDDGSAIYTWNNYSPPFVNYGRKITGNIILNGVGAGEGTSDPGYKAVHGIYMDDNVGNVEISSNTVANCSQSGIYIHNAHDLVIEKNTFYNNKVQAEFSQDGIVAGFPVRNIVFRDNILFAKTADQLTGKFYTIANDIGSFGVFENNHYCRPADDNLTIFAAYKESTSIVGKYFSLQSWQSTFNIDLSSEKCPANIPYFTIHNLVGSNKYGNGNFSSNIAGLYCYSSSGSCQTSWNSGGKLDTGALQFSFSKSPSSTENNHSYIIIGVGAVGAQKKYVLKFDVIGTSAGRMLGMFLRKSLSPYNDLSERRYAPLGSTRTSYEHLFTSSSGENDASLVFEVNEKDNITFWLDNISLYEANASVNDPDDYIRFEYNPAKTTKTVALDGTYVDLMNNVYAGTIAIEPYVSAVLMEQQDITLPLRLTSFSGTKVHNRVDLNWVAVNAADTDFFEIEKSGDGVNYITIGKVVSRQSASETLPYTFSDNDPFTGNNYYRIKQTDSDKKYFYSKVIRVHFPMIAKMEVNRSGNKLLVSVNIPQSREKAKLHILNISGVTVKTVLLPSSHTGNIAVDISSLSSGVYIIRLVSGNSIIINTPVIF